MCDSSGSLTTLRYCSGDDVWKWMRHEQCLLCGITNLYLAMQISVCTVYKQFSVLVFSGITATGDHTNNTWVHIICLITSLFHDFICHNATVFVFIFSLCFQSCMRYEVVCLFEMERRFLIYTHPKSLDKSWTKNWKLKSITEKSPSKSSHGNCQGMYLYSCRHEQ